MITAGSAGVVSGLQHSLAQLALWIATGTLVLAGGWLTLAAPETFPGMQILGLGLVAMAAFLVGLRVVSRIEQPAVPYLVTLAALLLVLWVKSRNDFVGWWTVIELLALATVLVIPAISVAAIRWLAILVVLSAVAWEAFGYASVGSLYQTPIAGAGAVSRLALLALIAEVGTAYLRKYAEMTDRMLSQSAAAMAAAVRRQRSEQNQRATRRVLHDTILNTLEAISRGLPTASRTALEDQCESDTRRWYQFLDRAGATSADPFQDALTQAQGWGLVVQVSREQDGSPPSGVTAEIAAAMLEALRNVRKHAQSSDASVVIELRDDSCQVLVVDSGPGFVGDPTGFGVSSSIHGRMADIGGTAEMVSTTDGGTTVSLRWRSPAAEDSLQLAIDLRAGVVRGSWILVALAFVGSATAVILDWYAMPRPLVWLAGLALLTAVLIRVLRQADHGQLQARDWWLPTMTLVGITLVWPVADQYCSATSTLALVPDLRMLLLVFPAILIPNVARASVALIALGAASAVDGWWWSQSWSECLLTPVPSLLAAALLSTSALTFGVELRRQEVLAQQATEERLAHQRLAALRRADQTTTEYWTTPVTERAVTVLRAIADRRLDPDLTSTRAQAGSAARDLRAMILIAGFSGPLGAAIREITEQTHFAGYRVVVRGVSEALSLPAEVGERWARSLLQWPGSEPTGDLTITVAAGPRWASLLLHRAGQVPDDDIPSGGGIEVWAEEDGSWWHAEEGAESRLADDSRTLGTR